MAEQGTSEEGITAELRAMLAAPPGGNFCTTKWIHQAVSHMRHTLQSQLLSIYKHHHYHHANAHTAAQPHPLRGDLCAGFSAEHWGRTPLTLKAATRIAQAMLTQYTTLYTLHLDSKRGPALCAALHQDHDGTGPAPGQQLHLPAVDAQIPSADRVHTDQSNTNERSVILVMSQQAIANDGAQARHLLTATTLLAHVCAAHARTPAGAALLPDSYDSSHRPSDAHDQFLAQAGVTPTEDGATEGEPQWIATGPMSRVMTSVVVDNINSLLDTGWMLRHQHAPVTAPVHCAAAAQSHEDAAAASECPPSHPQQQAARRSRRMQHKQPENTGLPARTRHTSPASAPAPSPSTTTAPLQLVLPEKACRFTSAANIESWQVQSSWENGTGAAILIKVTFVEEAMAAAVRAAQAEIIRHRNMLLQQLHPNKPSQGDTQARDKYQKERLNTIKQYSCIHYHSNAVSTLTTAEQMGTPPPPSFEDTVMPVDGDMLSACNQDGARMWKARPLLQWQQPYHTALYSVHVRGALPPKALQLCKAAHQQPSRLEGMKFAMAMQLPSWDDLCAAHPQRDFTTPGQWAQHKLEDHFSTVHAPSTKTNDTAKRPPILRVIPLMSVRSKSPGSNQPPPVCASTSKHAVTKFGTTDDTAHASTIWLVQFSTYHAWKSITDMLVRQQHARGHAATAHASYAAATAITPTPPVSAPHIRMLTKWRWPIPAVDKRLPAAVLERAALAKVMMVEDKLRLTPKLLQLAIPPLSEHALQCKHHIGTSKMDAIKSRGMDEYQLVPEGELFTLPTPAQLQQQQWKHRVGGRYHLYWLGTGGRCMDQHDVHQHHGAASVQGTTAAASVWKRKQQRQQLNYYLSHSAYWFDRRVHEVAWYCGTQFEYEHQPEAVAAQPVPPQCHLALPDDTQYNYGDAEPFRYTHVIGSRLQPTANTVGVEGQPMQEDGGSTHTPVSSDDDVVDSRDQQCSSAESSADEDQPDSPVSSQE